MTSIKTSMLLLSVFIAPIVTENMRSFRMSIMSGWQFQCANTTCLPFTTITASNIRKCQTSCLAKTQCQAASFHQLTTNCELFANTLNQNGNMSAHVETTTMIVITGTRIPSESNAVEETTQQTSRETIQQTSSGTTQQTSKETTQQTSSGTTQQTSSGTTQQTSSGTTQQTSSGTTQQTSSGTTQQTSSATTQQTSRGTTQQTSRGTTEHSTLLPTTTVCTNTLISPTGRSPTIGWYFENNFNDYFGKYNGTGQNNPAYLLGRNGCGKCLNLTSSLHQSVIVNILPYIDLRSISFSVEAWVKPMIVSDGLEHVVLTQCGALQTQQCMRVSIGNPGKMSFLFRSDNQLGVKTVPTNVWSHFAYVYDFSARTMSLYFNGTLDTIGSSHGPYSGAPTFFQIGNVDAIGSIYFDGCIDEIFFYPFARTASEILATFALG